MRGKHVQSGRRAVGKRRGGGDAEAVRVGGDAHDDLGGRHAGGEPGGEAEFHGALVVAGVAGRGEGCVGAAGAGPGAVDVVVHDHGVVEDVGEAGEVGGLCCAGIVPGEEGGGCGQIETGVGGAELLEEGEEVGRIVVIDGIAAQALLVGVLPAISES